MKKITAAAVVLILFCLSGVLYSEYHMINVYVCDQGQDNANLSAMVRVSRKELTSVSYCECEGVDPSMKSEVTEMSCEPPRSQVYSCVCVGRTKY